jgi:hypothetical protein
MRTKKKVVCWVLHQRYKYLQKKELLKHFCFHISFLAKFGYIFLLMINTLGYITNWQSIKLELKITSDHHPLLEDVKSALGPTFVVPSASYFVFFPCLPLTRSIFFSKKVNDGHWGSIMAGCNLVSRVLWKCQE